MKLIDADVFEVIITKVPDGMDAESYIAGMDFVLNKIDSLPPAQSEQRYTNEELEVFRQGISIRLLSLRSAQNWRYDEDTAEEIRFLEGLYEKCGTDMRGEENHE